MRVLILSCSTGGGHNSCAAAISEIFEEHGDFCETKDSLSFVSDGFADFMSKGHSLLYRRFSFVFKNGYAFAERHPKVLKKNSAAYKLITKGSEKLYDYISEGGFDAVICVHVFSGMILNEAFENRPPLGVKTAFLATDYTCSPGVEIFDYDLLFIPDESLKAEFASHGIAKEKLLPTGIPVRNRFFHTADKAEAKRAFGILPEHRHLLVMCGSMGCGPFEKIMASLCERLPGNIEITAVCGSNEKLRKTLYAKYKNNKNIHIMGYTEDVPLLMESADLYLTKPGGLSTSEALAKALPMVFINAVGGCEKHNMEYFLSIGGAAAAKTPEALAKKCLSLLQSEKRLGGLSKALEKRRKPFAAKEIYLKIRGDVCSEPPKSTIETSV
ncbi:MAG: glycosyltransferase [Oscillospiraceae bacterium]|nr:glycosyltransferase [Oscillospiraceae bacterium]